MNLTFNEIHSLSDNLIGEVKKFNGIFSINWHNTRMSDLKDPGWKDLFINIIKTCKEHKAGFLTGNQIYSEFTAK